MKKQSASLIAKLLNKNSQPQAGPETATVQEKIVLRDGVIQRFEFTFELSWKMLKRYLEEFGLEKVDSLNNRDLFRVGFEQGLLDAPAAWFHYLKMRNQTSHIYDADKAAAVFASARDFQQAAQDLLNRLEAKSR